MTQGQERVKKLSDIIVGTSAWAAPCIFALLIFLCLISRISIFTALVLGILGVACGLIASFVFDCFSDIVRIDRERAYKTSRTACAVCVSLSGTFGIWYVYSRLIWLIPLIVLFVSMALLCFFAILQLHEHHHNHTRRTTMRREET